MCFIVWLKLQHLTRLSFVLLNMLKRAFKSHEEANITGQAFNIGHVVHKISARKQHCSSSGDCETEILVTTRLRITNLG